MTMGGGVVVDDVVGDDEDEWKTGREVPPVALIGFVETISW